MKIVLLDGYTLNPGDLSWKALEALGELKVYERSKADQVVARCQSAEIVLTNKVIFDKTLIDQLPQLRYIGVIATGYNVVDLAYARERHIVVTNIPAYSTDSVAQMVFNKTLGIIGFGKIGQAVAQLGLAFGMKVIYHNRSQKTSTLNATQVDLDSVFENSDFLSINCPLTEENRGFINQQNLAKMKNSAFLINTGRGPLINEYDLAQALNDGQIAGAGLDVLATEPPATDNPLVKAKNCYITPHIAWATLEARSRLLDTIVQNIKAFQAGTPINVVN